MPQGVNWHNVASTMFAESWGALLVLPRSTASNIGWFGAATSNGVPLYVGFGPSVTIPVNGIARATDGWPVSPGMTLPLLTGQGENLGSATYVIANTAGQDFYVMGTG
jgi:hypothetical protein